MYSIPKQPTVTITTAAFNVDGAIDIYLIDCIDFVRLRHKLVRELMVNFLLEHQLIHKIYFSRISCVQYPRIIIPRIGIGHNLYYCESTRFVKSYSYGEIISIGALRHTVSCIYLQRTNGKYIRLPTISGRHLRYKLEV